MTSSSSVMFSRTWRCCSSSRLLAELQQFLEQFLDVPAAGVVALDQLLELLREVGAGLVQANQLLQLGADRGLEDFQVGVLVLRLLEALRQRLEVDLGQVHAPAGLPRGSSRR